MLYSLILFYMPFVCYSYVLIWHSYVICMYSYVILMSLVFTPPNRPVFFIRTIVKPNWNKACNNKKTSYVISISLICTRMPSVSHWYILVRHLYVTRMSSVCTRMSPVCTRVSSVCHSYAICMYLYVIHMSLVCTRMYLFVIRVTRMPSVCTRMSPVSHTMNTFFHDIYTVEIYIFEIYTYSIIINLYSIRNLSWSIFFSVK